jgi:hypothetical protein
MLARLVAQSKSRPDVSFGRALLVAAVIGFWMLAVVCEACLSQVSQHDGLVNRARQQQQMRLETSANAATFSIDSNANSRAVSRPSALFVDPKDLTRRS